MKILEAKRKREEDHPNVLVIGALTNLLSKFKGMNDVDDQELMLEKKIEISTESKNNIKFLDIVLSKKCKKCNSVKPPSSHHCSVC